MRNAAVAALAALAALPLAAYPQAGVVLMSVGEVSAQRGPQVVPLPVGAAVQTGDTIRVGSRSNLQVRMSDTSIIALRSGSEFRIDEYSYSGKEDAGDRSVFSLLKGGMRTITGAIGRLQRRDAYAVRTPTSTIGIRGTHYTLVHCENDCGSTATAAVQLAQAGGTLDDAGPLAQAAGGGGGIQNGTYGGVTDGRISVANQTGAKEFGHDEFFFVAAQNTAPQSFIAPPTFLFDRLSGQGRNQGQRGREAADTTARSSGAGSDGRASVTAPLQRYFGSGTSTGSQVDSGNSSVNPSTQRNDSLTGNGVVATDTRDASGNLTVVNAAPTVGVLGAWIGADGFQSAGGALVSKTVLTLDTNGFPIAFNVPSPCVGPDTNCNGVSGTLGAPVPGSTGMATPTGASSPIFWGRWASGTVTEDVGTVTLSNTNQAHLMYGPLAPPDVIAAKSGTVMWNSNSLGTQPTNNLGELGAGALPTITLDFTARTASVAPTTISFASQYWTTPSGSGSITVVPGQGAFFQATGNGGSCTGTGCSGSVNAKASGIFFGPLGDHAGVALSGQSTSGASFRTVRVYCASGC